MSSAAHHQDHVTSAAVPRAALPSAPRPIATALIWLSRAIPTAVVVTALGGLALWGHFSDWKLPKFSALVGKQDESVEEWCQEHNVPEEACIECK
jgi:hypothetical protein